MVQWLSQQSQSVLEAQRRSREPPVSSLLESHHVGTITSRKDCLGNRTDLMSEREGKQAKSDSFLLPCPFMRPRFKGGFLPSDDLDLGWVF